MSTLNKSRTNKLRIEHQTYPKSAKTDAFEQKKKKNANVLTPHYDDRENGHKMNPFTDLPFPFADTDIPPTHRESFSQHGCPPLQSILLSLSLPRWLKKPFGKSR